MQTIADAAGVSRMAVSLALRDRPSLPVATRRRIQKLAREMGYRPNPLVSMLMTHVRRSSPKRADVAMAYLNSIRPSADAIPAYREFHRGAKQRASQLGYELVDFYINDPEVTPEHLHRVFAAREIHGVVVGPLLGHQRTFALDWSRYAAATLGYSLQKPDLHRATNHHYQSMLLALRMLAERGRRRIGLAVQAEQDERVNHAWLAGLLVFQQTLPPADRIPPLFCDLPWRDCLGPWLREHRPDAVLGLHWGMVEDLQALGYRVPDDVAFALLDWTPLAKHCAGIDQNSDLVGAAAVDLVVGQLQRNERGVPKHTKVVMIQGEWVDGETAPPPPSAAA